MLLSTGPDVGAGPDPTDGSPAVESTAVRQVMATVSSAVAGAAVVAVLAAVPARAGGGAPLPPAPTTHAAPFPAPSRVAVRPAAWDRIGSVMHRAVVAEHPDAVVEPLVAAQDSFLGGVRLTVLY